MTGSRTAGGVVLSAVFLLSTSFVRADEAVNEKARWLSGELTGSDNRVASLRDAAIKEDGEKYSLFIKNQFKLLCELEFSEKGFPHKVRNCVSQIKQGDEGYDPGSTYTLKREVVLHCVQQKNAFVCTGKSELMTVQTGSVFDEDSDYITIARPAGMPVPIFGRK